MLRLKELPIEVWAWVFVYVAALAAFASLSVVMVRSATPDTVSTGTVECVCVEYECKSPGR